MENNRWNQSYRCSLSYSLLHNFKHPYNNRRGDSLQKTGITTTPIEVSDTIVAIEMAIHSTMVSIGVKTTIILIDITLVIISTITTVIDHNLCHVTTLHITLLIRKWHQISLTSLVLWPMMVFTFQSNRTQAQGFQSARTEQQLHLSLCLQAI